MASIQSMISRHGKGLMQVLHSRPDSCLGRTRGMKIVSAKAVNDGKQVDIEFSDKSAYRFHASWMKDSAPSNTGSDYYRKSANTIFETEQYVASEVKPAECGTKLQVAFRKGAENPTTEQYVGAWLHAFAPHVGRPMHTDASVSTAAPLDGTGSLLQDLHQRRGWDKDLELPSYTHDELAASEEKQLQFLEDMVDPGVARIVGMPPPKSLANADVGMQMENLVEKMIGRLNQHPVRATRYGVMHTRAKEVMKSADYDHSNPLSMHTDHSVYHGTPGYLQFLYQAQGSVTSKVCDGLAIAEHMRENHPEEYKLLTEVQITHSSRNNIYAKSGAYRADVQDDGGAPFELVHTHPVIQLDDKGELEKVVQSETKRGVCALPFDIYQKFMNAYKLWTKTVEDERFIKKFDWPESACLVTNNWPVLHGRATVPPGMARTMCFGYAAKTIVENRYRLLKQNEKQKKDPLMNDKWLTRLPNQVLMSLIVR